MGNDKGPISWLKNLLNKEDGQSGKKPGKYQYLLVVLLFGLAIMVAGNMFTSKKSSVGEVPVYKEGDSQEDVAAFGHKKTSENNQITDYEAAYETQLKEALEGISGVGDVLVVVNVDSTERKVLEKNTVTRSQTTDETDREGGKRNVEDASVDEQLVIIRNGEKEVPIVLETKKPAIRGVLVVAKGAENIQVKKWIIEAVTRSLDVPSHRVSVQPKKTKGD
ncbi:stage III sporulation protein AG [Bacillus sp. T33-2]|uniref:stage III sporulation protein AG n=1 Tax=Bacillus sp. T33-2 TaxID=2054168 RepID=UPI000C78DD5F|nr:stage III sporulation protein AG [Bacillus sp. T33-2]PLR99884.1 stage III sporulation protein AG [Bacillus sp. T33-2]